MDKLHEISQGILKWVAVCGCEAISHILRHKSHPPSIGATQAFTQGSKMGKTQKSITTQSPDWIGSATRKEEFLQNTTHCFHVYREERGKYESTLPHEAMKNVAEPIWETDKKAGAKVY